MPEKRKTIFNSFRDQLMILIIFFERERIREEKKHTYFMNVKQIADLRTTF